MFHTTRIMLCLRVGGWWWLCVLWIDGGGWWWVVVVAGGGGGCGGWVRHDRAFSSGPHVEEGLWGLLKGYPVPSP